MNTRFVSAAATFLMMFAIGLPSQARFADTSLKPASANSRMAGPESGSTAATKVLHGVVQGKQGALPGATVLLHGTNIIVVTNSEGEFELRVPADKKEIELTCSYGGLQEEVVRLGVAQALGSIYLLRTKDATAE